MITMVRSDATKEMEIDPCRFRQVLGQFATGVTVVTTRFGKTLHGMTVNSFCSVSLYPPLVLFCADHCSRTLSFLRESGIFAVNVLAEHQQELSDLFAGRRPGRDADRFAGMRWKTAATGAPVLEGTLAYLDCRVVVAYEAGDHTVFIGRVEALGAGPPAPPLLFYGGRYGRLAGRLPSVEARAATSASVAVPTSA